MVDFRIHLQNYAPVLHLISVTMGQSEMITRIEW